MPMEPAPDTKPYNRYRWRRHAKRLRNHPDEWVMLEASITRGPAQHVRSGGQADMAELQPHLEIRLRNAHRTPKGERYELWARYTPEVIIGRLKPRQVDDETVREIRVRHSKGEQVGELSQEFGITPVTLHSWLNGRTRRKAGGPIRTNDDYDDSKFDHLF